VGGSQGDEWGIKPESRGDAVGDQVGDGWGMASGRNRRRGAVLRRSQEGGMLRR
jgi:hypothetical protein